MTKVIPIHANTDVLGFYHKQKSEFHFQEKTDNDFLMFLLDTAVRVISIVQHLAPVIEAVSEASADEALDDYEAYSAELLAADKSMDIDRMDKLVEEVAHQQLTSLSVPLPPQVTKQKPELPPSQVPISIPIQTHIPVSTSQLPPQQVQPFLHQPTSQPIIEQPIIQQHPAGPIQTNAQPTEPTPELEEEFKSENIPEVVLIKDEQVEPMQTISERHLLPQETLNQLMNSISANEDNIGIANLVTTAQPSSLSSTFLDKANNPLSMLSLSNTANNLNNFLSTNTPGLCTQAESLAGSSRGTELKSLIDVKGASSSANNPRHHKIMCDICSKMITRNQLKRHKTTVHFKMKPYKCHFCEKCFGTSGHRRNHMSCHHLTAFRVYEQNQFSATSRRCSMKLKGDVE